MTVSEKVAYIKGLMAGMEIDLTTKEGKILTEILDVLTDLADDNSEIHEQLDTVDEDLGQLEEFVYETLDDDDWDCSGDCESCEGCDSDDYEYDTAEYSVTCPECGEEFFLDESALESDMAFECPSCHKKI